jgi:hypothetical protein
MLRTQDFLVLYILNTYVTIWLLVSGAGSPSSDDYDSKKRKQRAGGEPWGAKKPRHDLSPYRVHLTPYTVDR